MSQKKKRQRSSLKGLIGKPVVLTWVDACCDSGWKNREGEIVIPLLCDTVGYLTRARRDVINITMSKGENGHEAEVLAIPRGNVKKIRRLR